MRKDEHPVKLQPQPLRVLALLASRAGELVTRDEIKKELWSEDTFVDFEHGINFCINQIRTALGDDPEKPQFVQTVPRKGYRFLASVEALGAATDGSEPVAPKRRWRKPALVAAIVLVLLGSVWALWQLRAPTTDSAAPSIAVLHFDNLTGDAELDWLRTGLTDMLVTDLSQSPNLTVLSIDRLFQILSDLDRLEDPVTSFETVREVAERANTDTVVLGSFMKAGDNIRINVRIQDAPKHRMAGRWSSPIEATCFALRETAASPQGSPEAEEGSRDWRFLPTVDSFRFSKAAISGSGIRRKTI